MPATTSLNVTGSPPRLRGPQPPPVGRPVADRITPAPAGSTPRYLVWFLLTEARADRHAIRAAGLNGRPTMDEMYDYLEVQQGSSLADRMLRRHLRRFVDEQLAMRRDVVLSQHEQFTAHTRSSDPGSSIL